jgi:hypothetical protein
MIPFLSLVYDCLVIVVHSLLSTSISGGNCIAGIQVTSPTFAVKVTCQLHASDAFHELLSP